MIFGTQNTAEALSVDNKLAHFRLRQTCYRSYRKRLHAHWLDSCHIKYTCILRMYAMVIQ